MTQKPFSGRLGRLASVESLTAAQPNFETELYQHMQVTIDEEELKLATISMPGNLKISTLQERFAAQFGLMLRVYSGRSLANANETLSAVRKTIGEASVDIQANVKIGNLEKRFIQEYGIKVRVAGSDNSYLCDKGITLAQALREDKDKIANASEKLVQKKGNENTKGPQRNQNTFKLKALIESFSVAEQPDSEDSLPKNILEAKKIWEEIAYKSSDRVVELVKHHISCSFVAENIDDWRRLLRDENGGEFEANEIIVTDVDFSNGPLPLVSLACTFVLPLAESVSAEDVEGELENDCWGWGGCIIPRWHFSEELGLEDLDLTVGEHNGVEITVTRE